MNEAVKVIKIKQHYQSRDRGSGIKGSCMRKPDKIQFRDQNDQKKKIDIEKVNMVSIHETVNVASNAQRKDR